jgi:hypothetical protein
MAHNGRLRKTEVSHRLQLFVRTFPLNAGIPSYLRLGCVIRLKCLIYLHGVILRVLLPRLDVPGGIRDSPLRSFSAFRPFSVHNLHFPIFCV